MIFGIGDIIAFSHNSEPKQGVRDVKAMRQRTQSGQTSRKEKPVVVDTHDRYPQVLVLHNNWQGNIHGINLNQLSQQEINYLTAIIDPFFAAEIGGWQGIPSAGQEPLHVRPHRRQVGETH